MQDEDCMRCFGRHRPEVNQKQVTNCLNYDYDSVTHSGVRLFGQPCSLCATARSNHSRAGCWPHRPSRHPRCRHVVASHQHRNRPALCTREAKCTPGREVSSIRARSRGYALRRIVHVTPFTRSCLCVAIKLSGASRPRVCQAGKAASGPGATGSTTSRAGKARN